MDRLPEFLIPSRDGATRLTKRERTRRQLVAAAIATFSVRGIAETSIHEIAEAAEMTPGTVYNHFGTKADIVNAVAISIAQSMRERSAAARAKLVLGAEQIAAGCRRYLELAKGSPVWALLILDVAAANPVFRQTIENFVLYEIRLGIRRKEFRVASEAAALDMVIGSTMEAMRRIALGEVSPRHIKAVTTMVLCGLGLPLKRARQIAGKPLPLFDA